MTTLPIMVTRIEDEIDDENLRDKVILAIRSAIQLYGPKKFYFNQKTFTFDTVVSPAPLEFYTVSAAADIESFTEVTSSYITSGGTRYPFHVIGNEVIEDAQDGLRTGRPTNWAYFAQQFRCFPIPDAVYTATIRGYCKLAALTDDEAGTNTNAWMTDGEILIRQAAKRMIYTDVIKDAESALTAGGAEAQALDALETETALRRGRPTLQFDAALIGCGAYDIRTG